MPDTQQRRPFKLAAVVLFSIVYLALVVSDFVYKPELVLVPVSLALAFSLLWLAPTWLRGRMDARRPNLAVSLALTLLLHGSFFAYRYFLTMELTRIFDIVVLYPLQFYLLFQSFVILNSDRR